MRIGLVRMPPAQRAPWHGSGGWPELGEPFPALNDGCFFVNLVGEVDFLAGGKSFAMVPNDVLVINAVVYSYVNPGETDTFFWTLHPRSFDYRNGASAGGEIWEADPAAEEMNGSHPYYGYSEPAPRPDVLDRIRVVRWEDTRRQEIDWQGEWGSHWGAYPMLRNGLHGRIIRVPSGQVSKPQSLERETVYLGLGSTPVEIVHGTEHYPLVATDAFVAPEGDSIQLANAGSADAIVFEVTVTDSLD
jgi:hypothetical protein